MILFLRYHLCAGMANLENSKYKYPLLISLIILSVLVGFYFSGSVKQSFDKEVSLIKKSNINVGDVVDDIRCPKLDLIGYMPKGGTDIQRVEVAVDNLFGEFPYENYLKDKNLKAEDLRTNLKTQEVKITNEDGVKKVYVKVSPGSLGGSMDYRSDFKANKCLFGNVVSSIEKTVNQIQGVDKVIVHE